MNMDIDKKLEYAIFSGKFEGINKRDIEKAILNSKFIDKYIQCTKCDISYLIRIIFKYDGIIIVKWLDFINHVINIGYNSPKSVSKVFRSINDVIQARNKYIFESQREYLDILGDMETNNYIKEVLNRINRERIIIERYNNNKLLIKLNKRIYNVIVVIIGGKYYLQLRDTSTNKIDNKVYGMIVIDKKDDIFYIDNTMIKDISDRIKILRQIDVKNIKLVITPFEDGVGRIGALWWKQEY